MAHALAYTWTGDALVPLPRLMQAAAEQFTPGAVYWVNAEPDRSDKTHRHEFGWLREAWMSLPDSIAGDFPNPEVLRKKALIATGWCHVKDHACASKAEAQRLARALQAELDDYAVVIVRDDVVRVCRAKSQAKNRMKAAEFQASKTAVLEWVSALLGVSPEDLLQARAA